jgi:phage tail sheath protein FI
MAVYVAPGVYVREIDLSLYVPALSTTIVGMVGRAAKGPLNERTYITSQQQFVEVFGRPDSTIGYEAYAALQYLRRGRQLWYVRVAGPAAAASEKLFKAQVSVTGEIADSTPDGSKSSFSGQLTQRPVIVHSITMSATLHDDSTVTITDNGEGVLTGTTVSGTITYSTGEWTLVFTGDEPKDTTDITASYLFEVDGATFTATSEGEWGDSISILVEDGTNADTFKVVVYYEDSIVEKFDNLTLDASGLDIFNKSNFIEDRINDVSDYITVVVEADMDEYVLKFIETPVYLDGGDGDNHSVVSADIIGVAYDDGLGHASGLQLFASPGAVDINLIAAPGWAGDAAEVPFAMIEICESRADCMAIVDPPESLSPSEVVDWTNGAGTFEGDHAAFNSSYFAVYWPWVEIYDAYTQTFVMTPPSGHALAVYAYTDQISESWYAPAGVNRGRVISGVNLEYDATQGDMELLYGDGNIVNPIMNFPKDGMVIWGQRTGQRTPTALDRVNVRRLLLYMRKVIATACRALVFEPNDLKTWRWFGHLVTPFLNDLTQRRGLYDFRVKCDETTNTPAVIDRNEMRAQIFIKPIKAAEFIQVDIVITATGANFDELAF